MSISSGKNEKEFGLTDLPGLASDMSGAMDRIQESGRLLKVKWIPIVNSIQGALAEAKAEYARIKDPKAIGSAEVGDNLALLMGVVNQVMTAFEGLERKGTVNKVAALRDVIILLPEMMSRFSDLQLDHMVKPLIPKDGQNAKQLLWDQVVPESVKSSIKDIKKMLTTEAKSPLEKQFRGLMLKGFNKTLEKLFIQLDKMEMSQGLLPDSLISLLPAIGNTSFPNFLRAVGRQSTPDGTGFPFLTSRIAYFATELKEVEEKIKKLNGEQLESQWQKANEKSEQLIRAVIDNIGTTVFKDATKKKEALILLKGKLKSVADPSVEIHAMANQYLNDERLQSLALAIDALYAPIRQEKAALSTLDMEKRRVQARLTHLEQEQKKSLDILLADKPDENPIAIAVIPDEEEPTPFSMLSGVFDAMQKMVGQMDSIKTAWEPLAEKAKELAALNKALKDPDRKGDDLEQLINGLAEMPDKIKACDIAATGDKPADALVLTTEVFDHMTGLLVLFEKMKLAESIKKVILNEQGNLLDPAGFLKKYLPDFVDAHIKTLAETIKVQYTSEQLRDMPKSKQLSMLTALQGTALVLKMIRGVVDKVEQDSAYQKDAILSRIPVPGFKDKTLKTLCDEFDAYYKACWSAAGFKGEPSVEEISMDISHLGDAFKVEKSTISQALNGSLAHHVQLAGSVASAIAGSTNKLDSLIKEVETRMGDDDTLGLVIENIKDFKKSTEELGKKEFNSIIDVMVAVPSIVKTLSRVSKCVSAIHALSEKKMIQDKVGQELVEMIFEINSLLKEMYFMADKLEIRFGSPEGGLSQEIENAIRLFQEAVKKGGYRLLESDTVPYWQELLERRQALLDNKDFSPVVVNERILSLNEKRKREEEAQKNVSIARQLKWDNDINNIITVLINEQNEYPSGIIEWLLSFLPMQKRKVLERSNMIVACQGLKEKNPLDYETVVGSSVSRLLEQRFPEVFKRQSTSAILSRIQSAASRPSLIIPTVEPLSPDPVSSSIVENARLFANSHSSQSADDSNAPSISKPTEKKRVR